MTFILIIAIVVVLYVVFTYNSMVKLRNQVKEAWSDIDVQLKRRYNLIPNIVETVKGYAAHEEAVFTKVTEARANAINATNIKDQGAAENMLSGALKSLFAVAENYPELKANENFMQLQNELVDTEDKIQSARRFYNSITRDYNTKIQQFPSSLIAQPFGFRAELFFEVEEAEQRENVEVSFNKEGTRQAEAPKKAATAEEKPAEAKGEKDQSSMKI
jgi:LemA protein